MKYDITKHTAPQMPTLGKGTECIQILLSQVSKDMREQTQEKQDQGAGTSIRRISLIALRRGEPGSTADIFLWSLRSAR